MTEPENAPRPGAEGLRDWIAGRVAEYTGRSRDDIRTDAPLADYGLDSVSMVMLAGDLEEALGLALAPTVALHHPTIGDLADHLAGELEKTPERA
ncbi:acyl carrier protein [Kitasatospora sp. NPDC048545]|uniref:acyl carrier protein n=1 Tax=Kitasatospora sp. NPDC048545 TaxID=3157208 RepID=UPI0033E194D5